MSAESLAYAALYAAAYGDAQTAATLSRLALDDLDPATADPAAIIAARAGASYAAVRSWSTCGAPYSTLVAQQKAIIFARYRR